MKANFINIGVGLLLWGSLFSFYACGHKTTGVVTVGGNEVVEEKLDPFIQGNKRILALEQEEIALVIKRHHWNMTTTGTGLNYEILKQGRGECFVEGDSVALKYTIQLLSGEEVYNSETDGIKTFRVEKSEEIPALHEMAKLLSPGAKARLVVPSHLAYGVSGDNNRIKGREALIMNVEILNH
ncbi:MAG: FKBP-type peptidyl-prolyl cis-trans isomerase [Bacteroidales bacterium]|nr:FKBP-type peptidyl-prolyl cis-trans isomerase [Bacteroidales bacterium]